MSRLITGTVRRFDGTVWPNARVYVALLTNTATAVDEVYPVYTRTIVAESDGDIPANTRLETPESGAWRYRIWVESNAPVEFLLEQGDGSALSIDEVYALGEVGNEAGTPQAEFLNGLYALVNGAADGLMLETAGGDLALVESPAGTGGIEEPASSGLWARLVDGVGSWLAATAIGQALFAAVDAAAARSAIGAEVSGAASLSMSGHQILHDHSKLMSAEEQTLLQRILSSLGDASDGHILTATGDLSLVEFEPPVGITEPEDAGIYGREAARWTALGTAALVNVEAFEEAGRVNLVSAALDEHAANADIHFTDAPTVGLWARLRSSGASVWSAASAIGQALFSASTPEAARSSINAASLSANTFTSSQSYGAPIGFVGPSAGLFRENFRVEIGAEPVGRAQLLVDNHESLYDHSKLLTPEQELILNEIFLDLGYAAPGDCLVAESWNTVAFEARATLGSNTYTGDQDLNGNAIYGYRVREVATSVSGTYIINLLAGNLFVLTVTGNVTITFSNAPATGTAASATVILIQDGTGEHAVTFTGAKWDGGVAPDLALPADQQTDISFIIRNSGTDIRGYVAGLNMAVAA